jgi:hypothetical protein
MENKPFLIIKLPLTQKGIILSYLGIQDILSFLSQNKKLREIVNNSSLWRQIVIDWST